MKKEEILILSVGGSPEPLIYSINEFNPDKVIFLHSPETLELIDIILNETNYDKDKTESYEIADAEVLDDSFSLSKKVFTMFSDANKYDVRVDFTGGTKPMVSGLVLAVVEGNFSNFKFSYVGQKESGSRTKNGVGIVKDGSEITKMQINPYKKYAITEFKRGKNFFNTYQFEASLENFSSAGKKLLDNPNQEKLAKIYERIVLFYQKWDLFEDKFSKNTDLFKYLGFIINDIEEDEFIFNEFKGTEFYSQLKKNYSFLSLKLRGIPYDDESSNKKPLKFRISYYLSDLFNNAERRIKEGKYDDAVARLYRINELIGQVQLTNNELIDENQLQTQKIFKINIKNTQSKAYNRENYYDIMDFIDLNSNFKDKEKGHFPLANDKSFELLELFDIKQSDKFEKLNRNLKVRNNSILAHGLNPIGKKKAEELYEQTLIYAKEYFSFLDDDMDLAKFPKFP